MTTTQQQQGQETVPDDIDMFVYFATASIRKRYHDARHNLHLAPRALPPLVLGERSVP